MHISYTKQAEKVIKYAAKKAREMKHPYIGTEHLLLGLRRSIRELQDRSLNRTEWRRRRCCISWMN